MNKKFPVIANAGIAVLALMPSVKAVDVAALESAFAKVRTIADGTCAVTDVSLRLKSDPKGKDPLEMWRAEAKERVSVTGAFVRVDFTLVPEKGSDIKCRAVLPLPERWDGRLWGQGNSGRAGSLPELDAYVAMDTAAVTTDLGTTAASANFLDKSLPWRDGVLRDFHWRATHLMTVYGKRILAAFYGRVCEANGGIEEVSKFLRLFCIPGCAHGGGRGRVLTGSPSGPQMKKLLVAWCEGGAWRLETRPRGVPRIDALCLETKPVSTSCTESRNRK